MLLVTTSSIMKKNEKRKLKDFQTKEIKKPSTKQVKGGDGPITEDSLDM